MSWTPGDSVVLRRVWRRKLCRVTTASVVQDTPRLVALYWRERCPVKVTDGPLTPTRLASTAPLRLVDGVWGGSDVLFLAAPGVAHAVYGMWESGFGPFHGWYINLQEPLRRTPIGFDTMDHWLDVTLSADRETWRWKDEDEFAEAVRVGVLRAAEAHAIRAEGERARAAVQAAPASFYDTWRSWRPPAEWRLPTIPPDWDNSFDE